MINQPSRHPDDLPSRPRLRLADGERFGAQPPVPLTSFVGREREIAAMAALVRGEDVRLVTLTGPGGVGKTRLALRVAGELAADFTDGVSWVDLTPLTEPDRVGAAIARALGVIEAGDRPLTERLIESLHARSLLLVLDNFEQVVGAAPILVDLLSTCSGVKVLATSRVVLRVSGEHAVALAPLEVPGASPSGEDALAVESVRLFVARARASRSDFALTAANAEAVGDVVRRLDGLPLAIELAAARIAHLPPEALAHRLERRLTLLTGGARDLPARQRTLRDAIAWSFDLLPPEEQELFRRLSVFVDGFTLDAAEAVAGGQEQMADGRGTGGQESSHLSPCPPAPLSPSVFDGVASLIDKSLVREDAGSGRGPRYRMLETIREFGLEQLAASGEEAETRDRHAAWCLSLTEQADPEGWTWPRRPWFDAVESELPNLRAAMTWFEETGDAERGTRLAGALYGFWVFRSHRVEGRSWLERALAVRCDETVTVARARAVNALGVLALFLGDARAAVLVDESLDLWRALDHPFGIAWCLLCKGLVARSHGDQGEAVSLMDQAAARFDALESRVGAAFARMELGGVAHEIGAGERAEALFLDALALFREAEYDAGLASTLLPLGEMAADRGDLAHAAAHIAETLALWDGQREGLVDSLIVAAWLAAMSDRHEPAVRLLGAALALTEVLGYAPGQRDRARTERIAGESRTALGETVYAAAFAAGRLLSPSQASAEAQALLRDLTDQTRTVAQPDPGDRPLLTPQESDVLRLLATGRSDAEIAVALSVSSVTVSTHVTNIFAKLGVATRAKAAACAIRDGLI